MPSSPPEPVDLLDLKLVPAWAKEAPTQKDYSHYTGEESPIPSGRDQSRRSRQSRPPRREQPTSFKKQQDRGSYPKRKEPWTRHPAPDRHRQERPPRPSEKPVQVDLRFLPRTPVLENVTTQIQSGAIAYSLFFLARLFLERPRRYDVQLKPDPEMSLYRLGDDGPVSLDTALLEENAFRWAKEKFYRIDVTQSEPLKGNFSSVARCRLSGTVLGPTNYHAYQPRLRTLYEQRFSRRLGFTEYQKQIEIVTDPEVVERWKEDARTTTTFVPIQDAVSVELRSAAEAERHFRQNYLSGLIQKVEETIIDGLTSRQLADRALHRHIEHAWSAEMRSPSNMMQELSKKFRDAGLQIFRHRRGMLFVSSIRARPLVHGETDVSTPVKSILDTLAASPQIQRKELAEKLLAGVGAEELEARKLGLAADLHWLIREGYVIEFNDGSLDLPRTKSKKSEPVSGGETVTELTQAAAIDSISGNGDSPQSDSRDLPTEQPPAD